MKAFLVVNIKTNIVLINIGNTHLLMLRALVHITKHGKHFSKEHLVCQFFCWNFANFSFNFFYEKVLLHTSILKITNNGMNAFKNVVYQSALLLNLQVISSIFLRRIQLPHTTEIKCCT